MGSGYSNNLLNKLFFQLGYFKVNQPWLVIIIAAAIMLRVLVAFFMGDQVVDAPGTFDQISYDMVAQRVLNGYGFTVATNWWPATLAGEPTAHWSYLYTLYLVVIYSFFGYHPLIARLIQSVLGGIFMPLLVYRLGHRYFSQQAGLVAAALIAFYLYFVYYAGALMTETFYIVAILWVLDLAGQPSTNRFTGLWLGLALTIAVLLRQIFLIFIPVLYIWLLWRSYRVQGRTMNQTIATLGLATVILILAIAPWTYRNYKAFDGQFVLLNTNAGFAFFWGNHPIHGYNFISLLPATGPSSYQSLIPQELRYLNEAALDRALLQQGLGFIQADPIRYFILSLSRIKDYFMFWPSSDSGLISNMSRLASFGLLCPFMAYGFITNLRRALSSSILILYLFTAAYTIIHLLSWALVRYRLPVDAVLLVFAGATLVEVWVKLRQNQARVQGASTF